MAAIASLKLFEPFFGGDPKGAFLVQAMFNGTNYTDRANLNSGLLEELMRAENYKNYQNTRSSIDQRSQGPDDVHQDLTDLIITTALFHRSIDKSSTAGTNLGEAIRRVSDAMKMFLVTDMSTLPAGTFLRTPHATTEIRPTFIENLYQSEAKTIGDVYAFTLADRVAWELFNGETVNPKQKRDQINNRADANGQTFDTVLDEIFDCHPGAANNLNSLCYNSIISQKPNPAMPDQTKSAHEALQDLDRATGGVVSASTIGIAIVAEMREIFTRIAVAMKREYISTYPNVIQDGRPTNDRGKYSVANIKAFMSRQRLNDYTKLFNDEIDKNIYKAVQRAVETGVTVPHTALDDQNAKTFFDTVYSKWSTLPDEIRQFYTQNVAVFAKTSATGLFDPNVQRRDQHLPMDWNRLTDGELDKLFKAGRPALSSSELTNLRVNLMKDPLSGYQKVLFGANLPDITQGVNVWYTQANGAIAHITPQPPRTILKDLYEEVYANGNVNRVIVDGTRFKLNSVQQIVARRPLNQYNLDYGKFTAAAIKREDDKMASQAQQVQAPVSAELDYPFLTAYDMVYGKLWTFDTQKGQYYRVDESNRKVYYDDAAKGDTKTCYATYLAKGNDAGCLRVIQCILGGDHTSLKRCLDVIGDGSLWDVAADDVQKVGPDMVKAVLRKFGIKGRHETDSNGVKFLVPISYDEWLQKIVANFPSPVRETVGGNPKLLTYIKGLIGVCRSNPNILNKNNPSIIARDTTPEYIKNLNMRQYKLPVANTKTQYEFFAESLRNALQPNVVSQDLFNPITSGSFSNVMPFNPGTFMVPSMMGGHFYTALTPGFPTIRTADNEMDQQSQILKKGSATMFSSLLDTIGSAFADTGLRLHPEDVAKMNGVIKKMQTYENQLARMCSVLINIVQVARFYGIRLDTINKEHPRVMRRLSELHTVDDIRDFVIGYARELQKNMVSNLTVQQAAAYELMNRVGPRLLDDLTGRTQQPSATFDANDLVPI
jgi:hypothetical protein